MYTVQKEQPKNGQPSWAQIKEFMLSTVEQASRVPKLERKLVISKRDYKTLRYFYDKEIIKNVERSNKLDEAIELIEAMKA